MGTLDDILNDEEPQTESVIEEPQPETPAQPRDESGKFAPKGEQESVSPAPVEEPKAELEHPALLGERRRRQEAEARIAEMERQLQAVHNPPAPPPSVFEDEQGFAQHISQQVVSQAVSQASLNAKLDMSEMMVRQANPDFEDVKAEFLRLATENPALTQQALADPHPWNKAYQIAKNHKTMQELGATDLASLEAKLREKIMSEMATQQTAAPALPVSLAGSQSARATTSLQPAGPPSLDDILRS